MPHRNPQKARTPTTRSRPCHGINRALAYLSSGGYQGPNRLPIRVLAYLAGVSYVTMCKAVKLHRGSGDHAQDHRTVEPPAMPDTRPAWQRIGLRIEDDLVQGRLPRRPALPQIKQLCSRYRVTFRPVRRALDSLCERGVLHRAGRAFVPTGTAPPETSLRIRALVYNWAPEPLVLYAEYEQEFVRSLDIVCNQMRIGMDLVQFRFPRPHALEFRSVDGRKRPVPINSQRVAGYVLPVWHPDCINPAILARLHSWKKPFVIIDEIGNLDLPAHLSQSGRMLVVRARSYRTAGRDVARTLVDLGHRRIGFFSAFHRDLWSQQCLAGIEQVYATGGLCVDRFIVDGSQVSGSFLDQAMKRISFDPLHACYQRLRRHFPPSYEQQLDPWFSSLLQQQIWYAEVRQTMEPLLKRALADSSITCWVAADEDIAWIADDFRRVHAPGMPLVTFGYSPEINNRRITSHEFNPEAAAEAVIEHLVHSNQTSQHRKGPVFEVEGKLIWRESLRGV